MKKLLLFAVICCLLLPMVVSAQDDGRTVVSYWYHSGPQDAERETYEQAIQLFNETNEEYVVEHTVISQPTYHDEARAAAEQGLLPCVMEVDGPQIAGFAAGEIITPLDGMLDESIIDDLLPSIILQGTYEESLYALGLFDSGLGLWANKSFLEAAEVRIPTVDAPWDLEEFNAAMAALSEVVPEDGYVIDLNLTNANRQDAGWYFYIFTPPFWSFGGELLSPEEDMADGYINDPDAAGAFFEWWASLFENGYAIPNPIDGHQDFRDGKVAITVPGHWQYTSFSEALGEDLILLPMVDFGTGPVTGMGSWAHAIANPDRSTCESMDGAVAFLEHMMSPEVVALISGSGPLPARVSVLEQDERFAEGGAMHVYVQQHNAGWSRPRPGLSFTGAIITAWRDALIAIADGGDVQEAMDTAADTIDAAIEASQ